MLGRYRYYIFLFCLLFQHFVEHAVSNFTCDNGAVNLTENSLCTDLPQCRDCSDEKNCPGRQDFVSCQSTNVDHNSFCVSPDSVCNGIPDCDNCFDELNCPNATALFSCDDGEGCVDFNIGSERCLRPDMATCPYFCDGVSHCSDGSDERVMGFGFKCATINTIKAQKSRCIVPQKHLGMSGSDGPGICDDNSDKCFTIIKGIRVFDPKKCWTCLEGTIIQRQQICDGVFDCPDLSDECLCGRGETNICEQLLQNRENCTNENQVSCGVGDKCIDVSQICNKNNDCKNNIDEMFCIRSGCSASAEQYNCTSMPKLLIRQGESPVACDGVPQCFTAEDECEVCGDDKPEYCDLLFNVSPSLTCKNGTKLIGLDQLCNKVLDCENGFDEEDCKNLQYCDANNASSGRYDVRPCGPDRCNLEAVCDNFMDELNCSKITHFYCDGGRTFVPQWHRYDGIFDCNDLADECDISPTSVSSLTELIRLLPLRVCLWILMLFSLIGNGIVICKTMLDLCNSAHRRRRCPINRVGVCNKIMILNLAISDFFMGIYLFIIAVKSVELSGRYCGKREEWLTGNQCAFAGVIAVISSETSVFLMVLMTSYRLYGITNPFSAEKIRGRMIFLAAVLIWILSLLLAVIPILPSLHANFASAIFLDQPYGSNLLTTSNMSNLINTARELPGLNKSIPEATDLSVSTFCNLFVNQTSLPSYCFDPDSVANSIAGYYGSDGVCLPRYYGNANEPASRYSIGIIALNFVAFLYMFFAYLYIYRSTSVDVQQGEAHSSSMDENRSKENKALWGKIVRLIVTDFICWIPICIMSFVSFAGVVIPPIVYPITAILLVPINSAANPWLYSSFLANYVRRLYVFVKGVCLGKKRIIRKETDTASTKLSHYERFRFRIRKASRAETSMTVSVRLSTTGINPGENGAVAHASSPA